MPLQVKTVSRSFLKLSQITLQKAITNPECCSIWTKTRHAPAWAAVFVVNIPILHRLPSSTARGRVFSPTAPSGQVHRIHRSRYAPSRLKTRSDRLLTDLFPASLGFAHDNDPRLHKLRRDSRQSVFTRSLRVCCEPRVRVVSIHVVPSRRAADAYGELLLHERRRRHFRGVVSDSYKYFLVLVNFRPQASLFSHKPRLK